MHTPRACSMRACVFVCVRRAARVGSVPLASPAGGFVQYANLSPRHSVTFDGMLEESGELEPQKYCRTHTFTHVYCRIFCASKVTPLLTTCFMLFLCSNRNVIP